MESIRDLLNHPEYLHVLLHPLPIYGVALGAVALLFATALRSRAASLTALGIIFVSALAIWPVEEFGEQGKDRVESIADNVGDQWLDEHEERAERAIPFFYAAAALALAAMIVPWKFPKSAAAFSLVTVLLSVVAVALASYASQAGGKIRHREFRDGPPPVRAKH